MLVFGVKHLHNELFQLFETHNLVVIVLIEDTILASTWVRSCSVFWNCHIYVSYLNSSNRRTLNLWRATQVSIDPVPLLLVVPCDAPLWTLDRSLRVLLSIPTWRVILTINLMVVKTEIGRVIGKLIQFIFSRAANRRSSLIKNFFDILLRDQ